MHIQVKVNTSSSTGGFADDDDEESVITRSAGYRPGALADLLGILAGSGFNLRAAGGQRIELGGEFTFWVGARAQDSGHEDAARAARDVLREAGFDARAVEVSARLLDDTPGALQAFLADIAAEGLLVEDISVGTPTASGKVPVQVYTARLGDSSS